MCFDTSVRNSMTKLLTQVVSGVFVLPHFLFLFSATTSNDDDNSNFSPVRFADAGNYDTVTGRECQICQILQHELERTFEISVGKNLLKESEGLQDVEKRVCRRSSMEKRVKNLPSKYATHTPSLEWDCMEILKKIGNEVFDALALGEDLSKFCWSYEAKRQCTKEDRKLDNDEL